jgi:hypothetical protein
MYLLLLESSSGSICMAKIDFIKFQIRVKGYVKENWGSPFVVSFIFLLLSAAVLLSVNMSYWAEQIAVYAYYALVVGVALQVVCYVKYKKVSDKDD